MNIKIIETNIDNVSYFYPSIDLDEDFPPYITSITSFKFLEESYCKLVNYDDYENNTKKYEVFIKNDIIMFLWKKDCEKFIEEYLYPLFISISFMKK